MEFKYELTLPKPVIKDVVRAILSTILFHRLLGSVIPQTRETLGISYPVVMGEGAGEVDSLVEEKASMLVRALEGKNKQQLQDQQSQQQSQSHNRQQQQALIAVRFVDKTAEAARKSKGWFGTRVLVPTAEQDAGKVCWESWILTIKSLDIPDSESTSAGSTTGNQDVLAMASKQLREVLLSIVRKANEYPNDIPPITSTNIAPFPYEIVVYPSPGSAASGTDGGGEEESWGSVFKKILES